MLAVPGATPVIVAATWPFPSLVAGDGETVTIPDGALENVTVRPLNAPPAPSTVTVPDTAPGRISESDVAVKSTEVTGVTTVTVLAPDPVPIVAETTEVPWATPVTMPLDDTVATAVLLLAQPGARPPNAAPVTALPAESRATQVSPCVAPGLSVRVAGETTTVSIATRSTLTEALPGMPSLVAVIVVEPTPSPKTRPVAALTVATF